MSSAAENPDVIQLPVAKKWYKLSGTERFERVWAELGYESCPYVKDYQFDPESKAEFDYAWPEYRIAVEIHGFGFGHQAQQQVARDCAKIRRAVELGWWLLPFTTRCLGSREKVNDAVGLVCNCIDQVVE